ncbi:MAG TPA: sugar phosphate isomerase/epimerase family protein [Bacteroidales bacterium]|nr:sugar phosphate isomerase/epimerase family protein [Bacteroidales bacterium]
MIKLGFVSAILGELSLDEVINFASENGYSCVELMCWPVGKADRRYAGVTHIDVNALDDKEISRIKNLLSSRNVAISGLGYYPNPLHPEKEKSDFFINHILKVIDAAARLDVGIVNTFIGADSSKHDDDNFSRFLELWPPIIKYAEGKNIKIGIENCPMHFTKDEWPAGNNLAHSPLMWRKMFDAIPSSHFGLNLDPSHMVWQMMDYIKPVFEFREKIFHVHIKDAAINWDGINERGIFTAPNSIHTPKLPGLGDINWGKFFSALYEAGYSGPACVEVEDRAFEGSFEKRKASLIMSRNYLRQFITH